MIEGSYYDVMRHWLLIDGKPTKDFGVYLSGNGTFKAAEKELEEFKIPGRNGTFHYKSDTYKNVIVPYDCFIFKDFKRNVAALRSFLLSREGYVRIEDTHHPDEFRMGIYHEEFAPDVFDDLSAAQFTLNFDCKPERWLKSGERPIEYTANGILINSTYFTAKPLVRIYGTPATFASFSIGLADKPTIIIVKIPEEGYIDIDTENEQVYCGDTMLDSDLSFHASNTQHKFPTIVPGRNVVWFSGATKVVVTPRWWIL